MPVRAGQKPSRLLPRLEHGGKPLFARKARGRAGTLVRTGCRAGTCHKGNGPAHGQLKKKGYKFDNGEPVNADAFINTWNYTANGKLLDIDAEVPQPGLPLVFTLTDSDATIALD